MCFPIFHHINYPSSHRHYKEMPSSSLVVSYIFLLESLSYSESLVWSLLIPTVRSRTGDGSITEIIIKCFQIYCLIVAPVVRTESQCRWRNGNFTSITRNYGNHHVTDWLKVQFNCRRKGVCELPLFSVTAVAFSLTVKRQLLQ